MKKLDTAVTLTTLRDGIKNQMHTVEEAEITSEKLKVRTSHNNQAG
ncbi:MAG: hypothetical protein MZV49_18990 [Rhodopseudomonas palustris]|nr:hypothetical protein [Rhodopseudomonas palustris]